MITLFGLIGFALILVAGIAMMTPMMSHAITFDKPVDCAIGVECFIQNYVDLDSGEGWKDYRCGPLSYDGHKGTDFRLKNLVQMREGVNVLAIADGTVLRTRDSMPDISIKDEAAANIEGQECGNGLVIEHKRGIESQYCHLKRGSVNVKDGDAVKRGDVLGQIGMSGMTEFPHLHLQLRNAEGKLIDPFVGLVEGADCNPKKTFSTAWSVRAKPEMKYIDGALLSAGFTDARPSELAARNGDASLKTLADKADMMVFWIDAFGLRDGDAQIMQLMGPDRVAIVNHASTIEGNKAQWFQYVGKRLTKDSWPVGTYIGMYKVIRGERTIIDESFTIDMVENYSR